DLGAGTVKLACKSQCSVSWHANTLWDPDLSPRGNTFTRLRDAIAHNKLHLQSSSEPAPTPVPAQQRQVPPNWGVMPAAAPTAPTWVSPGTPPPVQASPWDAGSDTGLSEGQLAALESEHRNKIAALIKQQRLHIQSLTTDTQQKI